MCLEVFCPMWLEYSLRSLNVYITDWPLLSLATIQLVCDNRNFDV